MHSLVEPTIKTQEYPVQEIQKDKQKDFLLTKATFYHIEAARHQEAGDYERAANNIIRALNFYKKVE